jgi:pilus assembly protein CpaB
MRVGQSSGSQASANALECAFSGGSIVTSGRNPLLAALALGLLAGLVAWSSLRARERKVKDKWSTVNVLCAKADVASGTELDQEMVAVREIPAQFVTDSFIKVGEDGKLMQVSPVGQRVMVPLKAGDPILVSTFESAHDAELSTMIGPKGRAVTIDVQEKTAVGLWVRPNDHVDVIGSFRDPGNQESKTVTLLQNVVVLATGRVTANTLYVPEEQKKFQTVTLLVLPEEAQILTLGQELGQITLLLRNPEDLDVQEKRSVVDQKTLLTGERATELQQRRYKTIQIIRGNKSTVNETAAIATKAD